MNKSEKHALKNKAIEETKQWISKFIVGRDICSFAEAPFKSGAIRYNVSLTENIDDVIDILVDELLYIDEAEPEEVETSLLILPNALLDFEEYNQFLDVVDSALEQLELVDVITVDAFHPGFYFSDYDVNDVRNYTNRSIHPMFQFSREYSVEHARSTLVDDENIADNNAEKLLNAGLEVIKKEWESCIK